MVETLKTGDLIEFTDYETPMPRMGRIESLAPDGVNIAVYNLAKQKTIEFVSASAVLNKLPPSSTKAKGLCVGSKCTSSTKFPSKVLCFSK